MAFNQNVCTPTLKNCRTWRKEKTVNESNTQRKSNCIITHGIHFDHKVWLIERNSYHTWTVVWHFQRLNRYSYLFFLTYFSWGDNGRLDLGPVGVNELQIERSENLCQQGIYTEQRRYLAGLKELTSTVKLSFMCFFWRFLVWSATTLSSCGCWWKAQINSYVCRFKGKALQYSCQHCSVLQDNSIGVYKTSVVGNSADKIYNKHAKVLQPPPISSCSVLVSSDIFRGR